MEFKVSIFIKLVFTLLWFPCWPHESLNLTLLIIIIINGIVYVVKFTLYLKQTNVTE